MKEWIELEKDLRSWTLRRPSANLKARLFPPPEVVTAEPPTFRLSWLAPAFSGLMLMCIFFSQRNAPAVTGVSEPGPWVAMAMSNQTMAAWIPGSFPRSQNGLPTERFEWTNGSGSTSSMSSPSASRGSNE